MYNQYPVLKMTYSLQNLPGSPFPWLLTVTE